MPMDKSPSDVAQTLTPVREAQAALVRQQGLGMGAAMEQALAGLMAQLDATPLAAQFQPLPSSSADSRGEWTGLTQELMVQAFAQAITAVAKPGPAARQTSSLVATRPTGRPVDSGASVKPTQGQGGSARRETDMAHPSSDNATPGSEQIESPSLMQPAGKQMASVVPTVGAWQALSSIDALVRELARQDALPDQASRASTGGAPAERFPAQGFEVQAGRPTADTAKATDPGLPGMAQGSRDTTNFDSAPSQSGAGAMLGGLEGLVSSVWAGMQEGVQQAGASKSSSRPGGLLTPQRLGAAASEQALSSSTSSSGASRRDLAPRSPTMLAPAGQRSAASSAVSEATGGKLLAALRIGESANDALNPAAPGAVPTGGNGGPALSDEALAEQINRVLIEQAWRGGSDLS